MSWILLLFSRVSSPSSSNTSCGAGGRGCDVSQPIYMAWTTLHTVPIPLCTRVSTCPRLPTFFRHVYDYLRSSTPCLLGLRSSTWCLRYRQYMSMPIVYSAQSTSCDSTSQLLPQHLFSLTVCSVTTTSALPSSTLSQCLRQMLASRWYFCYFSISIAPESFHTTMSISTSCLSIPAHVYTLGLRLQLPNTSLNGGNVCLATIHSSDRD